ncbi:GerMN domain-containing protein, partial [Paenibacillus glucanolyticus]
PADTKDVNATETQAKKANIKLYYTDPEIIDLKEASKEITYSNEEDKYTKAFEGLQKSSDAELNPLWSEQITLNSLKFDKGALTLDITKPAEANLGAGGEMFALDALRKTFFQFDEVKSLELLVDGNQTESLMGHVELEHPMTRN